MDEIDTVSTTIICGKDDGLQKRDVGIRIEVLRLVAVGKALCLWRNNAEDLLGVAFPSGGYPGLRATGRPCAVQRG